MSALKVAEYILSLSAPEEGDIISHLKLQKLLYYTQGFHLALHNTTLFDDVIKHWKHGPVVETVYQEYKKYGDGVLPKPESVDFTELTTEQIDVINEVYNVYGQFSAWKLRQMTHEEPPWKDTFDNEEITPMALSKYFKTQIN